MKLWREHSAAFATRRDIPTATQLYEEALKLQPQLARWLVVHRLHAIHATDSYAAARVVTRLTHYIDLTPNAAPALALRGLCEFELADDTQSLIDIQRALALGAANQSRNEQILRYHEALLLTRSGRFEEALQSYSYFVRNGINNPDILLGLGLAGLRDPLLPKDIPAERQELLTATGSAAYQSLAGDDKKAQQSFQDLFQRFPDEANAHYLYGYLLFAKDPDQAVAQFKRAADIAPANASAQAMLAWSSLVRNNASEALPYAEKAVKNDPSLPLAQLVLGRSLIETGDSKKTGSSILREPLQLEPTNLEVHLALARGYSEAGRNEEARRERACYASKSQRDEAELGCRVRLLLGILILLSAYVGFSRSPGA